jgi:threonine dehydrogenase-like Zn-dependent dehydrogenase
MGLFSALLSRLAGGDVLLTGLEHDRERLSIADRVGFKTKVVDSTVQPSELTPDTNRNGFDVCIDATGVPAGLETGLGAARDGGTVVVVGILSDAVSCDWSEVIRREIMIAPSHGSVTRDFFRVLDILESEKLPIADIIDTSFSITTPTNAFDAFVNKETIKPVFDVTAFTE